jgi:hypothetical protein
MAEAANPARHTRAPGSQVGAIGLNASLVVGLAPWQQTKQRAKQV